MLFVITETPHTSRSSRTYVVGQDLGNDAANQIRFFLEFLVMLLRRAAAGLVFLLAILTFQVLFAAGTEEEIAALLHFVEQSECTFIRNEKSYTGAEARGHIELKYDHFKEKIAITEDFIKYAATQSLMSGRPYKVRCNSNEMNLADWLQDELNRLRTAPKTGSKKN